MDMLTGFVVVEVVVVVTVLVLLKFFRPQMIGRLGECILAIYLRHKLDPKIYRVIDNVILPTDDEMTTQIDHVIVSRYGVFVVETKTYDGSIYGRAEEPRWTHVRFRKKSGFQNPLRQNYRHMATIAELTGIPMDCIKPIIAFAGTTKFKTQMPEEVVHFCDVPGYVRKLSDQQRIKDQQVADVAAVIREWASTVGFWKRLNHTSNLKRKYGPVTRQMQSAPVICPKCGQTMVLRTKRDGSGQFYGCSAYPACRSIRNLAD